MLSIFIAETKSINTQILASKPMNVLIQYIPIRQVWAENPNVVSVSMVFFLFFSPLCRYLSYCRCLATSRFTSMTCICMFVWETYMLTAAFECFRIIFSDDTVRKWSAFRALRDPRNCKLYLPIFRFCLFWHSTFRRRETFAQNKGCAANCMLINVIAQSVRKEVPHVHTWEYDPLGILKTF